MHPLIDKGVVGINKLLEKANLPDIRVLSFVLFTSWFSVFSGYYFAIVNVAEDVYHTFLDDSLGCGINDSLSDTCNMNQTGINRHPFMFGFTITMYNVGSLIGSFFVPYVAERFGRRMPLMVYCNILNIVADVLMAVAIWLPGGWALSFLVIGRTLSGLNAGMVYVLLPIYITEVSSTKYRGFNASVTNLMISANTLVSLIIALPALLGSTDLWFYLHALGIPFALIQIFLTPLLPESPKYLLLHKKNEIEARASLEFFQPDLTDQEMVSIFTHYHCEQLQQQQNSGTKVTFMDCVTDHRLRRAIGISICVMLASITTGIVAIFTYSTTMFAEAFSSGDTNDDQSTYYAQVASIVMSLFNTLGAVVANFLIDRIGRRKLLLTGLIGCTICNTIFMIFVLLHQTYTHTTVFAIIAVVFMIVHVTLFNVGPGAIMWFICSEVTPQAARSIGSTLCMVANSLGLIVLNFGYPPLQQAIKGWVFLFFIIPTLGFIVVLYIFLPETKNREVDEILRNWYDSTPVAWKKQKQRERYQEQLKRQATLQYQAPTTPTPEVK